MFARILCVVVAITSAASAADKPKSEPEGVPLELAITGKLVKFELDTGGLSEAEYKKAIEDAGKGRGAKPPATPKVEFSVEIKNTSDKPLTVWTKGDPVVLDLELKGKGAMNIAPPLAFTREFRIPSGVEIAPGKSVSLPVKSLTSGFRGASVFSYWTAPGEYELTAKLKTGVNPAPKGAKEADEGFGEVKLTSLPLRLTVEAKK